MNKKYITLILILLILPLKAQMQPIIKTVVDTTAIRPGEQIRLQVTTQTDTLSFVDFPELTTLGNLEVVKSSGVDTLQDKPLRRLQKKYFLTAWDSGHYTVPSISIKINDTIVKTDSLKIQIQPVKVDTTRQGLYGFKAPVNLEGQSVDNMPESSTYIWWLAAILILTVLAYYFYRRRQYKIAANKASSPYEKALYRLEKLQQEQLWQQNRTDEHYLNLTDLLKTFLEEELDLSAKEKISNELIQSLKAFRFENGTYFSPQLLERLSETLQRADLAKFAKISPNQADIYVDDNVIKNILNDAHQIIEEITAEKAAKEAEIKMQKRRKQRLFMGISGALILVLLLIGGAGYYYLHKMKIVKNLSENLSAAEWVYNEYGSDPVLALTTPHILHPVSVSKEVENLPENIKKMLDEVSFYADENLIKKYAIVAGSLDFKQALPQQIDLSKLLFSQFLKNINAREVNMQEADLENAKRYFGSFIIDLPVVGNNIKVEFDSRFYTTPQGLKMLTGFYIRGNKDNQALIERVMQTAELVK